jgi:hypothetical protein
MRSLRLSAVKLSSRVAMYCRNSRSSISFTSLLLVVNDDDRVRNDYHIISCSSVILLIEPSMMAVPDVQLAIYIYTFDQHQVAHLHSTFVHLSEIIILGVIILIK